MTATAAAFEVEYLRRNEPRKEISKVSGEGLAILAERIAITESWLVDQGVDVPRDHQHMDPNSPQRLYWHYGYLMGMKYALETAKR
jgi:hypothetical protein